MLVPVILSGGAGTRLWPVSREAHPKPFIKLADGESLLQKTFNRINALTDVTEILTITNRDYLFKTKDEYARSASPDLKINHSFLLEPFGRNTAPAILFAALAIAEKHGPDAVMLVLPADHLIENTAAFSHTVKQAQQLAAANKVVTFGVVPTEPETGFGYIECGLPHHAEGYAVTRFVEKPAIELAREYLASGNYLWNAGIFCFKAGVIIDQFQQHADMLFQQSQKCWEITKNAEFHLPSIIELDSITFADVPDISIDYAIMEKSQHIVVVSSQFDWNDIGSWDRMIKLFEPDSSGNATVGNAMLLNSTDTFVYGDNRLVASIGVNNLVIIDTHDALLVADRAHTQDVKQIVQQLKTKSDQSYKTHRTTVRPWGAYTVLEEGENFKIKRIVVKPGASLSLQLHKHRSEHWVVVEGTANVINGDEELTLRTNESTFIPKNVRHRLENPGLSNLILIEVQTGHYLGEDDIIRFDDQYGRQHSEKEITQLCTADE